LYYKSEISNRNRRISQPIQAVEKVDPIGNPVVSEELADFFLVEIFA
jgi:hypothetical protein